MSKKTSTLSDIYLNITRLDTKIDTEIYNINNPSSGSTIINGNFDVMHNINVSSNVFVNNNISANGNCTINGTTMLNKTIINGNTINNKSGLILDGNQNGKFLQMEPDGTVKYTGLDSIGLTEIHGSVGAKQIEIFKINNPGPSDDNMYFYLNNTIDIGGAYGDDDIRKTLQAHQPTSGELNILNLDSSSPGLLNVKGDVNIGEKYSENNNIKGKLIINDSGEDKLDGIFELHGNAKILGNTISNNFESGALVVTGGVGIGGKLNVYDNAIIGDSSNNNNGLVVYGNAIISNKIKVGEFSGDSYIQPPGEFGLDVDGDINVSNNLTVDKQVILGAKYADGEFVLDVNGSTKVKDKIIIGTIDANVINDENLLINGSAIIGNVSISSDDIETSSLIIKGDSGITGNLIVKQKTEIKSVIDADGDNSNGALTVDGGVFIGQKLYVGSVADVAFIDKGVSEGAVKVNGGVNICGKLIVNSTNVESNIYNDYSLVAGSGVGIIGDLKIDQAQTVSFGEKSSISNMNINTETINISGGVIEDKQFNQLYQQNICLKINCNGQLYYLPLFGTTNPITD